MAVFNIFYDGVNCYRFICADVGVVGKAHAGSQGAMLVDVFVG